MSDSKFYKDLLDNASIGYALHKIILDKDGIPEDYEFIDVNTEFEKLTGLKAKNILNCRITEILPEIKTSKFNWIEYYGDIALKGGEKDIEQFSDPLKQWYHVKVYSPEKNHFVTIFNNISREKIIAETPRLFLEQSSDVLDYQKICDNLLSISNARYAALNIFEPDSRDFSTVALSGLAEHVNKAPDFLGFRLINKKWKHDPVRAEKIAQSTITRFKTLHELTEESIPESIVKTIVKTFGIGETAVLKILKGANEIGDFTILMPEGETLKNDSLLEIYAQQVSLIIEKHNADKSRLAFEDQKNRTDELLQKNENLYQTILSSIQDVVFTLDSEQRHTGVYGSWVAKAGLTNDNFIGRKHTEILGKSNGAIHEQAN